MTPEQLAAIRERIAAATPGLWEREDYSVIDDDGSYDLAHVTAPAPEEPDVAVLGIALGVLRHDAELIAHAPEDIAALLTEVDRLTADNDMKRQACQTLGSIIERYGNWVVEVTDSQDLIGEDGDGDWEVVWDRLFEMKAERDRLRAELTALQPRT